MMIKNLLSNAALAFVTGLFLLFVAYQGYGLFQNFITTPEPEHHAEGPDLYAGLTPEEVGQIVFAMQGCMGCHNLDLKGGAIGPSLSNFGERWRGTAQELVEKLVDPKSVVPNTFMPSFSRLGDEELEGIAAFLLTLKSSRLSPDNDGLAEVSVPVVKDDAGNEVPKYAASQIERDQQLFISNGCIGCHTIAGIAPGGLIGPNLTHEAARKRSDVWQAEHIKLPYSVYVLGSAENLVCSRNATCMPGYATLPQEDVDALVAFLQSLK